MKCQPLIPIRDVLLSGLLVLGINRCFTSYVDRCGMFVETCLTDGLPDLSEGARRVARSGVAAGSGFSCAKTSSHGLKCWGENAGGKLGVGHQMTLGDGPNEMGASLPMVDLGTGKAIKQIEAGHFAACALLNDDNVKCWGANGYGELGQGHSSNPGDSPDEMGDALSSIDFGSGKRAKQISVGNNHACAVLSDGSVKCWGYNSGGQLGQGHVNSLGDGPGEMGDNLPAINLGTGRSAKLISVGVNSTFAILDNGSVKCWGENLVGTLGLGHTESMGDNPNEMGDSLPAVDLGTGKKAVQISAGGPVNCALLEDGSIKCWGAGGLIGQGHTNAIGNEPNEMGDNLPPINLGTGKTAQVVVSSEMHTCAILNDDSVKCWGDNTYGRLGYGHTDALGDGSNEMGDNLPVVNLGNGRTAKEIAVGVTHTCALLDDGSVKCWGGNDTGGLGQGHTNDLGDSIGEMGDNLTPVSY